MKPTSITPPTQFWSLRRNHFISLLSLSKPLPRQPFPRLSSIRCNSSVTSVNFNIPQQTQKQKQNLMVKEDDDDTAIENFEEVQQVRTFPSAARLTLRDQAFFLLTFVAFTALASFTGFVMAVVPTLYAMSRTAIAFAKLADTAREELPSTMAAIRLSGMEISDLTLELSDLSQEISDGVTKSAQAVQAAEAGVRHIGSLARYKTMSMIEERANLPEITIQPVVAGVAKKTSQAVGHAGKTFMKMISGADSSLKDEGPSAHIDTLP